MTISDPEKEEIDKLLKKVTASQIQVKAYWNYSNKLQSMGNRYVFLSAKKLCLSGKKIERLAGVTILSQLFTTRNTGKENSYKRLYRREAINILKTFINSRDEEILRATIYGLGHLNAGHMSQLVGSY